MASAPVLSLDEVKKTLENMKKKITSDHPAKDKIPENISQLVPSKNSGKIKYFQRVRC